MPGQQQHWHQQQQQPPPPPPPSHGHQAQLANNHLQNGGGANADPYANHIQQPYRAGGYHPPPVSPGARGHPGMQQWPHSQSQSQPHHQHHGDLGTRDGSQRSSYNGYGPNNGYPQEQQQQQQQQHQQHQQQAQQTQPPSGRGVPHPPSYAPNPMHFSGGLPAAPGSRPPHAQYEPSPIQYDYNSHGSWASNGAPPSVLQSPGSSGPGGGGGPRGLSTGSLGSGNGSGAGIGGGQGSRGYPSKLDDGDDFDDDDDDRRGKGANDGAAGGVGSAGGGQKGTSDFVKKLFGMLSDPAYENVVTWAPSGETFLVKDMNDFTKHVLPRNFRHSNFASFVRQLNKYDFHKVKTTDEPGSTGIGEHQWEFQHPDFIRGREDLLENVRRKIPAKRKAGAAGTAGGGGGAAKGGPSAEGGGPGSGADTRDDSPVLPLGGEAAERAAESYAELKAQVASLTAVQDQLSSHINGLTKQYQGVIGEMLTFQKNMVQQDQLMQSLIQYLMNVEADKRSDNNALLGGTDGAFVPSDEATKLIANYEDVTQASFATMSEIAQRVANGGGNVQAGPSAAGHLSSAGTTARGGAPTPALSHQRQSAVSVGSSSAPLSPKSVSTPLEDTGTHSAPAHRRSDAKGKAPSSRGGVQGDEAATVVHPPHEHIEADAVAGSTYGMLNAASSSLSHPNAAQFERAGLRVFTVGTLQPREGNEDYLSNNAADPTSQGSRAPQAFADAVGAALRKQASPNGSASSGSSSGGGDFGLRVPQLEDLPRNMPRVDGRANSISGSPNPYGGGAASGTKSPGSDKERSATPSSSSGGQNFLRVRRSTFVPGWAIPPRVLLVDDDAVCRKLSSKFLQVFGCSIDFAVDGMSAVNKMNLEKYDLVLMDIVMPNLDGVSATSLIRQFDPRTPIISMTSNSGPSELMQYMANGMNDILPKPFTKEGLLNMLEKHLIHLKTVQKMEEIPRSLGLDPVTGSALQNALQTSSHRLSMSHGASSSTNGGGPSFSPSSEASGGNGNGSGAGDDSTLNPLAGMGFSDEEYIAMLQNLIAAGSFSDASGHLTNPVSSLVGTMPGEGVGPAGGARSKEGTPMMVATGALKRQASEGEPDRVVGDAKRGRFTEIH